MVSIPDIVNTLQTNREHFRHVFLQAQQEALEPDKRKGLETVAMGVAEPEAYDIALRYAQGRGFLEEMIDLILERKLHDGRLLQLLIEAGDIVGNAVTEAITDPARPPQHVQLSLQRLVDASRWTCQIYVDDKVRGTGVLIRPNLVLTAWHVLIELFDPVAGGDYRPAEGAGERLTVEFDNFLKPMGRTGSRISVHANRFAADRERWCVVYSLNHPEERANRLPSDITQLRGFWDFAVIRLARSPGLLRNWAQTNDLAVEPKPGGEVYVFQHPDGQPMLYDRAKIVDLGEPMRNAVQSIRFIHDVNTDHGSSGGPCFDHHVALFGLHQGKWSGDAENRTLNRGIPMQSVLACIREKINELPALEGVDDPVWTLGRTEREAPVFGALDFQQIAWQAATSDRPKLLLVRGDPGSGKSFRLDILAAMLPVANHLVVKLEAKSISKVDPLTLVRQICSKAGIEAPTIEPLDTVDATEATWRADEIVVKLLAALDQARNNRRVWITIRDLNVYKEIVDPDTSELLMLLYDRAASNDWLYIVLDDMKGDLALSSRYSDKLAMCPTSEITRDDVLYYAQRAQSGYNLRNDEATVRNISDLLYDTYDQERRSGPDDPVWDTYDQERRSESEKKAIEKLVTSMQRVFLNRQVLDTLPGHQP
jgi:hypothetical protein